MASDEAARVYMERTPKEDQTATGVWDAMTEASDNMVEAIKKKDFTKYLAIANPKHGDDFLEEVSLNHFNLSFFVLYFIKKLHKNDL